MVERRGVKIVRAQAGHMSQREVDLYRKVEVPRPYSLDQLSPIIDGVIAGQAVDWQDPNSYTQFTAIMNRVDKPIMRSIVTLVSYDPQSPQIIEAFQKLTDDLSNFTPDASLIGDPVESKHWTFKFHLNVAIVSSLAAHLEIRQMGPTRELKRLMDQIEKQRKQMIKTLDGLTLDDLDRYLIFSDGLYLEPPQSLIQDTTTAINAQVRRFKKNGMAPSSILNVHKAGHSTLDTYCAFIKDLSDADNNTWSRLSKKWGWKQVKSAVSSLRTAHQKIVLASVLVALEENLVVSQNLKAKFDPETIGLMPNDFVTLLRSSGNYDDYDKEWLEEYYPALAVDKRETLALEGLLLPKHILPMATIRILNRFDTSSPDKIKAFLGLAHIEISADRELSTKWLATIIVLKKLNPDFEDFYNDLIDRFETLPQTVRDISLDRRPGSIWLDQNSRIRVNLSDQPQRGYLLHTSIAEAPVDISAHQSAVKPAEKREDQPQYQTLLLPFIGLVNLLDETGVSSYISSLKTQAHGFQNEDELLSEFEELQRRFKEQKNGFGTIIFLSKLNTKDQKHRNIRNLGLEGIVIRDQSIDLIASGQPPFAICARMDENGLLHIPGTGDSFIGEPVHLLFNNLVLDLSSRPFSRINETRPETAHELRDIVRNWNRFKSDNFPRITLTNPYDRTNIAITAGPIGNTETFLLNEA